MERKGQLKEELASVRDDLGQWKDKYRYVVYVYIYILLSVCVCVLVRVVYIASSVESGRKGLN